MHQVSENYVFYEASGTLTGASASGAGTVSITYEGYKPTGVAKKFKLSCAGGKLSPVIPITVCNPVAVSSYPD